MMKDARWGAAVATGGTADDNAGARDESAWPKIPMAAANALKFEPWRSNEFDAKFGPGMSALVMRWGNNG
jgi:hypothetical protein